MQYWQYSSLINFPPASCLRLSAQQHATGLVWWPVRFMQSEWVLRCQYVAQDLWCYCWEWYFSLHKHKNWMEQSKKAWQVSCIFKHLHDIENCFCSAHLDSKWHEQKHVAMFSLQCFVKACPTWSTRTQPLWFYLRLQTAFVERHSAGTCLCVNVNMWVSKCVSV